MHRATGALGWPSTRLQQLQCVSTGTHWSYHNSTPIHQHKNGKMITDAQSNLCTHIDGPAQDCSDSSPSALELPLFRTKTPIWQQTCRPTCVLISMAQCKTAATPVHQHWSYHTSTPSHRHEHDNIYIGQLVYWHFWPSARLQQLQCQHWSYHSSTPSHPQYDHGNRCINQLVHSHWWPSARL